MSTVDFVVDTVGEEENEVKSEIKFKTKIEEDKKIHDAESRNRIDNILEIFKSKRLDLDRQARIEEEVQKKLTTLKIDTQFDDFFFDMGWTLIPGIPVVKKEKKDRKFHFTHLDLDTGKLKTNLGVIDVEKEMRGSVLKPGIEKQHSLPAYHKSDKKLKEERKKENSKTKGPGWFNMAAPELTPEVKNDLQVLKMRSVLDPKTFKKRNDMEVLPKYFQVGRIMDSALEHQSERITNKQRKRTMVDELLADAEFQRYNKRKYKQIIEEKRKGEYRTHMRDKRHKRKAEIKEKKSKKAVSAKKSKKE